MSFDPYEDDEFVFEGPDLPPGEDGTVERQEQKVTGPRLDQARPAEPGEEPDIPDCGTGDEGGTFREPATLTHEGDDWVLFIPATSPLQDRPVAINTGPRGELGVAYQGNDPGSYCAVLSSGS